MFESLVSVAGGQGLRITHDNHIVLKGKLVFVCLFFNSKVAKESTEQKVKLGHRAMKFILHP